MKKLKICLATLSIHSLLFLMNAYATSYTWNGTTSTAWATGTNWTPNGVPGASDNVTIVSASNNPIYNGVAGITNFTMTSGTLNLNNYTLAISGNGTFNGGAISNGEISASGSGTVTFAGTTFDCSVETSTSNFYLNGSVFNNNASFEKTGGSANYSYGGNIFNDTVIIIHSSSSGLLSVSSSEPDTFNMAAYFEHNGSTHYELGYGPAGIYCGGDVYLKNLGTHTIYVTTYGSIVFEGDIYIASTNTNPIYFGYPYTDGVATLTDGTIYEDAAGFNNASLYLFNFSKTGNGEVNLDLSSASLTVALNSVINGNFNFTGSFFLNGCTFNDSISFTHNNSSTNYSTGGNIFNGYSYFTNTSTGNFYLANSTGDDFNNTVTFQTTSTGRAYPAYTDTTFFSGDLNLIGSALSEPAKSTGIIIMDANEEHYIRREYSGVTRAFNIPDEHRFITTFDALYISNNEFRGKMW